MRPFPDYSTLCLLLPVEFFASLKGREFSFRNGIWERPINPECRREKKKHCELVYRLQFKQGLYCISTWLARRRQSNQTLYQTCIIAHITYDMIALQIQKYLSSISYCYSYTCFLTFYSAIPTVFFHQENCFQASFPRLLCYTISFSSCLAVALLLLPFHILILFKPSFPLYADMVAIFMCFPASRGLLPNEN